MVSVKNEILIIYRHTACLAYAVFGMFYSVVANGRRLQYTYITLYSVSAHRGNAGCYSNIVTHTFVGRACAPFVFYISLLGINPSI